MDLSRMNFYMIGCELEDPLYKILKDSEKVNSVNRVYRVDNEDYSNCVAIVYQDAYSVSDLQALLDSKLKNCHKVFYRMNRVISGIDETVIKQLDVSTLRTTASTRQCYDSIIEDVFGISLKDNCFTFLGCAPKVGTTLTVQTIGYKLAKTGLRVCYLDLSGHNNFSFFSDKPTTPDGRDTYSVDSLKVKLINQMLSDAELEDGLAVNKSGVYCIEGCSNILTARHISVDMSEYLIDKLRSLFDIVLVDAGSPSNYALSFGALTGCSNRILVGTDSVSDAENFAGYRDCVLNPMGLTDMSLILNRIHKGVTDDASLRILSSNYTSGVVLSNIPELDNGYQCELSKKLLYNQTSSKPYIKGIDTVVNFMLNHVGKEIKEDNPKLSFFRKSGK